MAYNRDNEKEYGERNEHRHDEIVDGKSYVDGFVVSVKFASNPKAYFFHSYSAEYKANDPVVVETVRGIELGHVEREARPISDFKQGLLLKPLLRKATSKDLDDYNKNIENAKYAMNICRDGIRAQKLDMHLLRAEYTLDGSKAIFNYSAENRVDFRELLKELSTKLKCRIELRQIGSRDRAKLVGGIGICGLPLCCSTFLGEFDAISINMAKNQFLVLNIQKLSGHCGKLLCCLKYEDNDYTQARKGLPRIGQKFIFENDSFRVANINVLTKQVRIESKDSVKFVKLEDVLELIRAQQPAPAPAQV
jgi:cell fate regulator YaaT (PSP1 superfamily)